MNIKKMKTTLIFLLSPLLMMGYVSSALPMTSSQVTLAQAVISQLSSGPLQNNDIVVFLDETSDQDVETDSLFKSFGKPVSVLFADVMTDDEVEKVVKQDSLLFLLNVSPDSSLFSNPPQMLEAKKIIAFNMNPQQLPTEFFSTILIEKSKMATVFHPFVYKIKSDSASSIENVRFKVYQATGFDHKGKIVSKVQDWNIETFDTLSSVLVDRWNSLGGQVLRLASDYDDRPLIYQKENGEVTGLCLKILDALAIQLDFKYTSELRSSPDEEWGSLINGSWNGMLGQIFRKERNLTINYFTVTYERLRDFDFSASYYNEGFGFALKIPSPLPRWMSLLFPFSPYVWMGIGVALVVSSFVFYIYRLVYHHQDDQLFVISFVLLLKSLLKQSVHEIKVDTKTHSILAVMWWSFSLIIGISYTCNFIAFLTVTKFPPRIQSVEELADSDNRVIMIDYGEFVPEALRTSKANLLRKLGDKLDLIEIDFDVPFYNYGKAGELVMNGTHAHIETFSYLKLLYVVGLGLADNVYFMPEQVYYGNLAFFFPKNTPWKHKFDEMIQRLVEAGIVMKYYDDILADEMGGVVESQKGGVTALYMGHFQGAFYIFGIFVVIATLIFFVERSFPPKYSQEYKQ